MSWSAKRRLLIILLLFSLVVILIAIPGYFLFYEKPTCNDGKQNQGEAGVDCGGSCQLLCPAEAFSPIIHWQRVLPVSHPIYNAVAYVENPNLDSAAFDVPYVFKLYDAGNVLVSEKHGVIYIPPRKVFAIFEGGIVTGERIPVRATFGFEEEPKWQKVASYSPELVITNRVLTKETSAPRLEALIENNSTKPASRVEVVALLYEAKGNIVGASRTFVDRISEHGKAPIVFTWPSPFSASPTRIEITYRVLLN